MIHTHLCIITYTVLNVPFSFLLHYIIRVFLNLSGWILNSSMTAPSRRRTNYLTLAQPCIIGRRLSTTYLGLACLLRPSPPFVATFWESLGAAMSHRPPRMLAGQYALLPLPVRGPFLPRFQTIQFRRGPSRLRNALAAVHERAPHPRAGISHAVFLNTRTSTG